MQIDYTSNNHESAQIESISKISYSDFENNEMETSAHFGGGIGNTTDDFIDQQISDTIAARPMSPMIDRRRTDPKKSPKAI